MKTLKPITLFLLLFGYSAAVRAQTEKFLAGGSMSFRYTKTNPEENSQMNTVGRTYSFSAAPVFGFTFVKNMMAGVAVEFTWENTSYEEGISEYSKYNSVLLTPFYRYYFFSPLFAQVQFSWGPANSRQKYNPDMIPITEELKFTLTSLGYGFGLGYDIRLADHICLEPMVRYIKLYNTSSEENQSFRRSDILFNLGIFYRF